MATFLSRYEHGEHEQVWAELLALDAQIREEPLYSDALAVARETMRRVRYNIELLIPRLQAAGYVFGYTWLIRHEIRDLKLAEWRTQHTPPPYAPSQPDVQARLAELEQLVEGSIPLSFRAWYEVVGQVSFVGDLPQHWGFTPGTEPRKQSQIADTPPLPPADEETLAAFWKAVEASYTEKAEEKAEAEMRAWDKNFPPPFDPLVVNPIEEVLDKVKYQLRNRQYIRRPYASVSPDAYFKYYISGGGPYRIIVPNAAIDGMLEGEWHDTTFASYLRICFSWAGLPGLTYFEREGKEELQTLTEGLLPL